MFWTADDIAKFEKGAPAHIARFLIATTETGLRPGDLVDLRRAHVHPTPKGHRIVIWTAKRKRLASIPVTTRMAALIAATPAEQQVFIVNKAGKPYQHENYLGDAVSQRRDKLEIRIDLRLYDARGTAAIRLLMADASLKEIATAMGWSQETRSRGDRALSRPVARNARWRGRETAAVREGIVNSFVKRTAKQNNLNPAN